MMFPGTGAIISGPAGDETLRLEELLGRGAFGDVFRASEIGSQISYAVKFPAVGALQDGDQMRAFLNEVEAAGQIEHPNVVRIVHVETAPAHLPPYMVMEYVEGGNLRDRLNGQRGSGELFPVQCVRQWCLDLAAGMDAINAHVIHRDVRPENILMKGDTPLIADFGISKVVGAITRTKTFKGGQHILYMAPEGWRLQSNKIQIDMYSVGIVLFEIATLEYPFEVVPDPHDMDAVRRMHLFEQPRSVRALRDDLPVGVSHVTARLLAKRAEDRFRNWSEVIEALDRAWSTSEGERPSPSGALTELLDETERAYNELTRHRLEREKREAAKEERQTLDLYQMGRLMDDLMSTVTEYNEESALGTIEVDCRRHSRQCWFDLPFAGSMFLGFDWIDPPLSLKVGQVRFLGLLKDDDGAGVNYLLCRTDESDLYGKWKVCRITQSPLVHPGKMPRRLEPFGLGVDDARHIQAADEAMHIYNTDFSDDLQDAFLQAALRAMRRRRRT